MSLYQDADCAIREALENEHAETLRSCVTAGHWYSGYERRAIVAEARHARCEAGLQEDETGAVDGDQGRDGIPEPVRRVARQVAVSTNDMDRGFVENALRDGLSDAQYVEIVGLVSSATNIDLFARGIGIPVRSLPQAVAGEPSHLRPQTARDEGAWVPTVPGGIRGGEEAKLLYGSGDPQAAPFIYRALSLVPSEAARLIRLGSAQYLGIADFMDLGFTFEPTLSRPQYELVAARVSALNECFY